MNLFNVFKNSPYKSRIKTATWLVVLLAIVFIVDNKILTWSIFGIIYIICFWESLRLFDIKAHNKKLILLAALIFIPTYFSQNALYIGLFGAIVVSSVVVFTLASKRYILPFIYPSIPILALLQIYTSFGLGVLIWLILAVALADIGAFFAGKRFGKTKLCKASPNKSVEGALGGIALSLALGGTFGYILGYGYMAFIMSFIMGIISIGGDLFESSLKREVSLKDSSNILPGHGGLLDRLDGHLFVSIALLAFLSF